MAGDHGVKPITPMICPVCGTKVIFEDGDRIRCDRCRKDLIFNDKFRIWYLVDREPKKGSFSLGQF